MFATLNHEVKRLRGVSVEAAELESTMLMLAHGMDLFYTRLMPSRWAAGWVGGVGQWTECKQANVSEAGDSSRAASMACLAAAAARTVRQCVLHASPSLPAPQPR